MKNLLLIVLGLTVVCSVSYGIYWVCKNVSYWIFYEDMVQETVREMVKAAALK